MITIFQDGLDLLLKIANVILLGYALYKFTKKPHDTLDQRVTTLEVDVKNIKESLNQGQDKFRAHDGAIEILLHSTLVLVEYEMQYCLEEHKEMSDGLKDAKNELHKFLSKR